MSLLIKALDKAQSTKSELAQAEKSKLEQTKATQVKTAQVGALEDTPKAAKGQAIANNKLQTKTPESSLKTVNTDTELSLSPTGSSFSEVVAKPTSADIKAANPAPVMVSSSQPAFNSQTSNQQLAAKSAANVFSAKGVDAKTDSKRLALIAGAGLIALLGMGLYFYQFVDNSAPILVPPRPLEDISAQVTLPPEAVSVPVSDVAALEKTADETTPTKTVENDMPSVVESAEPILGAEKRESIIKKRAKAAVVDGDEFSVGEPEDEITVAQSSEDSIEAASAEKPSKKMRKSKNNAGIASDSASIQVTKSTPPAAVSPTLMSAYEAYNAGNDKEAIKLYKQVLQRDVRNVDALLGLGAIASRQGREADANGWYGKVLEVDPRNNIAKTAMLDGQSQGNELTNETSLKNMLAKQPDDANLHVALGNLYAEQNQWPAAQQAYFDAYSLNKTADNAYNLAVSLDQMGKPKLALPYYQRALDQASNTSNIDKAVLEARIAAIQ
jgi:tetratricopeptide (TPR) repeat protein